MILRSAGRADTAGPRFVLHLTAYSESPAASRALSFSWGR
jgi:hypothetical protein